MSTISTITKPTDDCLIVSKMSLMGHEQVVFCYDKETGLKLSESPEWQQKFKTEYEDPARKAMADSAAHQVKYYEDKVPEWFKIPEEANYLQSQRCSLSKIDFDWTMIFIHFKDGKK